MEGGTKTRLSNIFFSSLRAAAEWQHLAVMGDGWCWRTVIEVIAHTFIPLTRAPFNPHRNPLWEVLSFHPYFAWGNWGTQRESDAPAVGAGQRDPAPLSMQTDRISMQTDRRRVSQWNRTNRLPHLELSFPWTECLLCLLHGWPDVPTAVGSMASCHTEVGTEMPVILW